MTLIGETVAWLTDPAHWSGPGGIPVRVAEHLALSLTALLVAVLIALPIGLWIGHTRRSVGLAVNGANLARAIPSLALIGILVPFTALIDPQLGFRILPTLIAMIALGIPPILVNAYTGVSEVDRDLAEAARGMGLTEGHILRSLELPLALPVILGGVGSATVQIIATATLGAIFGFGGLGTYLTEGISQNDDGMVYGGVVLIAVLALTAEGLFTLLARRLTPPGVALERRGDVRTRPAAAS
ncbi:MAG TPA: ABC transporter permease [Candidatus Limnocylindrales bacterium]|jgi:osmoprotectant transport system permease protein